MDLPRLLSPDRIRCQVELTSKKRALQTIAEMLCTCDPSDTVADGGAEPEGSADPAPPAKRQVFDALVSRERLGSTGLGHGVALPHSRIEGLDSSIIALVTLANPVDYEAPDGQGVDILCGLLVPTDCNDEHLQILADLAGRFNQPELRESVRAFGADDADALFAHLVRSASAA